jgi:hypothetical protein
MSQKTKATTTTPFYMRWFATQSLRGINLGSFSLSLQFSFLKKNNAVLTGENYHQLKKIHQTFTFFAEEQQRGATLRVSEIQPTVDNMYSDISILPLSVQSAIQQTIMEICKANNLQPIDLQVVYPTTQTQAALFEKAATEIDAQKIIENAKARQTGNNAQNGLNNGVLYIS